jgi:tetratricopeptide (TPR) repeat protein
MPTNYFKWEGTRRGTRWEKPALAILAGAVLASGAHAYTSYHRHQVAVAHCKRGETAWCEGRMTEAEREFTAALRADAHHFSARDQLSIVAWQQGNYDRSLALLREGVRLHPDSADAHRSLGESLFLMHDFAAAIPALERAERLQPTEPGRPSLLQTCREALADPPKFLRRPGSWTSLRSHATIHSSRHHAEHPRCQDGRDSHMGPTESHRHDHGTHAPVPAH